MGLIDQHLPQHASRIQTSGPLFHLLKAAALDLIPRATAILLLWR
jgi:hypothetical protein